MKKIKTTKYTVNNYIVKVKRKKRLSKMCKICAECANRAFCKFRKNIPLMRKCENCRNCTDKENCDVFYINNQVKMMIPIIDEETGKVICRKCFSGKDEHEAIYKSQQYIKDIEAGIVKPEIKKTIHSISSIIREDEERKSKNGAINDNTYITNLQTLNRIEQNAWAFHPIKNVNKEQLEKWLFKERESGKSNSVLKKDYRMLKRAYSIAKFYNYVPENPFEGPYCISIPKSIKKDHKTESFTLEEFKKLIDYLANNNVLHRNEHLLCLHSRNTNTENV